MYATLRRYIGNPDLATKLLTHRKDIESLIRGVKGFEAYYMVKTGDGIVSVTICEDRTGTEESNKKAATWIKENLPDVAKRSPELMAGEVVMQLTEQPTKART
jgi:hypothetical protein